MLPTASTSSLLERARRVLPRVHGHYTNLEVQRGEGCWVIDRSGKRYLDFSAGVAVLSTGHCHPRVVAAIQKQAAELIHICAGVAYSEPHIALLEKLAEICPGDLKQSFISQSGSETIEAGLKCARSVTGREAVVCFEGGFHGRTLGATSITTSKAKYRDPYQPWLIPQVHCLPYPSEAPFDATAYEKLFFQKVDGAKVAAIVVEPILGKGGYVAAAPGFLKLLRKLSRDIGALLIFDEIQTGMGRTGSWFACQHEAVVPDLMALAKGLGSGVTIGALVGTQAIFDAWPTSTHGGTYPGNPLNCAAALETIRVIEDEHLIENATAQGALLKQGLDQLQARYPIIAAVRAKGLMIGLEIGHTQGHAKAAELCKTLRAAALESGLLTISSGLHDQVIRICPPLILSAQEAQQGIDILAEVFQRHS